jgi:hypothetical protein
MLGLYRPELSNQPDEDKIQHAPYIPMPEGRGFTANFGKSCRPNVQPLEVRLTLTASVTNSFIGVNGTGWYPPDTNLAVGPRMKSGRAGHARTSLQEETHRERF